MRNRYATIEDTETEFVSTIHQYANRKSEKEEPSNAKHVVTDKKINQKETNYYKT